MKYEVGFIYSNCKNKYRITSAQIPTPRYYYTSDPLKAINLFKESLDIKYVRLFDPTLDCNLNDYLVYKSYLDNKVIFYRKSDYKFICSFSDFYVRKFERDSSFKDLRKGNEYVACIEFFNGIRWYVKYRSEYPIKSKENRNDLVEVVTGLSKQLRGRTKHFRIISINEVK